MTNKRKSVEQPPIRWTKAQQQSLKREINAFNRKIEATAKRNPEIARYLPKKINYLEQKKSITTNRELIRLKNSLIRAKKPDAFMPVTDNPKIPITKWEKRDTQIKVAIANRKRRAKNAMLHPDIKMGNLALVREAELRPKKFDIEKIVDEESYRKFVTAIVNEIRESYDFEKLALYRNNYYQGLYQNFGDRAGDIIDKLNALTDYELYEMSVNHPQLNIQFQYTIEVNMETRIKHIGEEWNEAISSKI